MIEPPSARDPARVLWITSQPDTPSGVRPDLELARALAPAGFEIHVMARIGSHAAQAARHADLPVIEFPPRGLFGRLGRWAIHKVCVDRQIRLVHLFDPTAMAAAVPAVRDLPLPIVARHARTGGVQRWNPVARLTVLQRRINRVICTSEAARAELSRRRDPATVLKIPPGQDIAWYEGAPLNLLKLGVPPQAFPIAVVADYHPRHGIEYIIDAAEWLPTAAHAFFLIAGRGHENRFVLERIQRSPWRENFRLLGPRLDAPRLVAACAVSVRATLGGDGLPQAIMESMACGVPPVIADAKCAAELVTHGETGIIVRRRNARAIGEALSWMYEHPVERMAMGVAARARIEREFPLQRTVDAHLALYRRLCEPAPAASALGL
jgi:glycosyltransferase involved in cell wall biosynthesis